MLEPPRRFSPRAASITDGAGNIGLLPGFTLVASASPVFVRPNHDSLEFPFVAPFSGSCGTGVHWSPVPPRSPSEEVEDEVG